MFKISNMVSKNIFKMCKLIFFNFQAFYYIAIVEDFVLRFGWALSMSLTEMGYVHGDLMVSILSPLEVMRLVYYVYYNVIQSMVLCFYNI